MASSRGSAVARARPGELWRTVAWGIGLFAACRAIQLVLEAQALASLVGQVVLVEWGAGHLGIGAHESSLPARALARRAAVGVIVGAVASALVIGTLWATRGLLFERVPRFELSLVAIGLLAAGLQAWRDEMLTRGVVFHALEHARIAPTARLAAFAVTSAGLALGRPDVGFTQVVVSAELGILFGALWSWDYGRKDRARLAAPAAHTAFRWSMETLVSGGLVQARLAATTWAGGNAGILGGKAAVLALLPMCAIAIVASRQRISPRSA